MSEAIHFIRVHRPFSHPKQWIKGPVDALTFTQSQDDCGKYTKEEAEIIIGFLHSELHNGAFVVTLDGI